MKVACVLANGFEDSEFKQPYDALREAGHDVTIYERFEMGHKRGSSHGATRIYRFSYPDERYVAMMKEALALLGRIPAAHVRPPLTPVTAGERQAIRHALAATGLLHAR